MDYETMRLVQEREEVAFKIGREAGYEKGLKKGKSIGSHQAYNHFVKHGHWVLKGNGNADCSICGYRSTRVYDDDNADRYCRHCGAAMVEDCDAKV